MNRVIGFFTMKRGKKERADVRNVSSQNPEPETNKFKTMPTRSLQSPSPVSPMPDFTPNTTSTTPVSPKDIEFLSNFERQIIEEINLFRTNPQSFLEHLENRKKYYDMGQKTLSVPGFPAVMIDDGIVAVNDAVNFVKSQKAVNPLSASRGMCLASKDHVNDIGVTGATTHQGTDKSDVRTRLARHAAPHWNTSGGLITAQQIGFSITDSDSPPDVNVGREIVLQILIEDGAANKVNRVTLMNPDLRFIGVGYGTHSQYDSMYVLAFANKYDEKGTAPPSRAPQAPQSRAPQAAPSGGPTSRDLNQNNTTTSATPSAADNNTCGICNTPLGLRRIIVEGKKIHPECFSCFHCKQKLEGGTFYPHEGKLYCDDDFWQLFGAKCEECKKIIKGGRVEADGKAWHPNCFPDMAL